MYIYALFKEEEKTSYHWSNCNILKSRESTYFSRESKWLGTFTFDRLYSKNTSMVLKFSKKHGYRLIFRISVHLQPPRIINIVTRGPIWTTHMASIGDKSWFLGTSKKGFLSLSTSLHLCMFNQDNHSEFFAVEIQIQ